MAHKYNNNKLFAYSYRYDKSCTKIVCLFEKGGKN